MTDNEVITALEVCSNPCLCDPKCQLLECDDCTAILTTSALAIIKRQQSDISELKWLLTESMQAMNRIANIYRLSTGGDGICGLCEYGDIHMNEPGVWGNKCPGVDSNRCFRWRNAIKAEEALKMKEDLPDRQIIVGGEYQHFKGGKAHVLSLAKHSETGEDLVVYECIGGQNTNHKDGIYARPVEMFLSEVDHEKYPDVKQKYRFEYIRPDTEG
ncbi:MAG: DUF1653 domain-containing protein [Huintestinicola sp.]